MTNVTILGTGIMGAGMAHRLLETSLSVTVWNRNRERAAPIAAAGAAVADTPGAAVDGADLVLAMLADDDASRSVWLGDHGALAAMPAGAVAIECSTLTRDWVAELAAAAAAREIALLDAPVTGSRVQAAGGQLRFLVGGDAAALDRARPVLAHLGTETVHLGPSGAGATLKLVNNFLCGIQVASLGQAIAAIERSGLDVEQAFRLLRTGAPGSPIVNLIGERMLNRAYEPHFLLPLMGKDLSYAGRMIEALGGDPALAEIAKRCFDRAAEQGFDGADMAAVVEPMRAECKHAESHAAD